MTKYEVLMGAGYIENFEYVKGNTWFKTLLILIFPNIIIWQSILNSSIKSSDNFCHKNCMILIS